MSVQLRRLVAARARHCCEYCRSQERFSPEAFSVEHIEPRGAGGETAPHDLALSCQGCNSHKYTATQAVDPVTQRRVPIYNPRKQHWPDHFAWSPDCTEVVGRTPTGRATVEALRLNRDGLVNLRRLLRAMDEHPPAELPEGT